MPPRRKEDVLVVGGSGFLGARLVQRLLDDGTYNVRVFDLRKGNLENVAYFTGDITDEKAVTDAVKGCTTVFHTASPPPLLGDRDLFFRVNVEGTRNLLTVSAREGVVRFVYTSSASVVFQGRDIVNGDEHLPYPEAFPDPYNESKAAGEKLVLASSQHATQGMATIAVRPHQIFGPGDVTMLPEMAKKAQQGAMKVTLGGRRNLIDWTYVDNVVDAHVLAAQALAKPNSSCAGQFYFITNNEPREFWKTTYELVNRIGYNVRPWFAIPYPVARVLVFIIQIITFLLSLCRIRWRPVLTPYVLMLTTCHRTFSTERARRDLGYVPKVSLEEGFQRTIDWYLQSKKDQQAR